MNNIPPYFSARLIAAGILGILSLAQLRGDSPKLGQPVILASHAIEVNLSGQNGSAYTVEASTNLSNWFLISGGIATNGLLTVRHDAATNYPALFYRGKGTNTSLPPLTLGLKTDTNISVSTLVSLDGGTAVLYGRDGTRFTLSLPSNSIPDARILTMTLVTNITGLPFGRGTLGTVLLEPADLSFWGAASLEITFPATTDRREVVSFFCHGDGSSFQLTPDRVSTNRVIIGITHAGTFGSSLATTQELANAANIEIGGAQPLGLAAAAKSRGIGRHGPTSPDCFPEKQLAANQARAEIDAARAQNEKQVAALLGAERQRALSGDSDDSSAVLAQVAVILCQFYNGQIAPRWPEAMNNCALGEVLTQNTLGLERMRQLLGTDPNDQCTAMSNIPFCAIFKSCLEDIRQCCANGMKGPKKVAAVFGLLRQDQLLGLNCISQDEAQEVIELCSANVWTGTFSMVETGSQTTSSNLVGSPGSTLVLTSIAEYTSRFNGAIEESQEGGAPEVGYLVELRVGGQIVLRDFQKNTSESTATVQQCPGSKAGGISHDLQLHQVEQTAATNTIYAVSFLIQPGGRSYEFLGAVNFDDRTPDRPMGSISLIDYQGGDSPCSGPYIIKDFNRTSPSPLSVASTLTDASGIMTDTNVVSGTFSTDDSLRHIVFKWNFTRHNPGP